MTPTLRERLQHQLYIFTDAGTEETAVQFCNLVSEGKPLTYTDAMCSLDKDKWLAAMHKEINRNLAGLCSSSGKAHYRLQVGFSPQAQTQTVLLNATKCTLATSTRRSI